MVGRSKRLHMATSTEVETSKDDDIVCLDIPAKQRRRNKTVTKLKVKTEKKSDEISNEFAGFDVEDASEDEKRQIRAAILASTSDQKQQNLKQQSSECMDNEGSSKTSSQRTESSTGEVIEINSEEDQSVKDDSMSSVKKPEPGLPGDENDDGKASSNAGDDEDDDETQPPSDADENEFVLNLDQPTLDESMTEMSDTESAFIEECDNTLMEEDIKPEESEGFEADIDKDDKDIDNHLDMDYLSKISQQPEYRQRTRRSGSRECFQPSCSKDKRNSPSLKSASRESMDTVNEAVRSSGSKSRTPSRQNSMSSSQSSEIGTEHVPLKRHYRAVRPEFQTLKHDVFFGKNGTEELQKSALAIYQLFEIYRTKLKTAQRKLGDKMIWSEPIKTGQHQTRTLDVKRRGKESVYIDLSDSDEDFQDANVRGRGCANQKSHVKTLEDKVKIPEMVIESENSSESVTAGRFGRKPPKSRTAEADIMSAETQPYDIDTNKDEDFVFEAEKLRESKVARLDRNLKGKQTDEKENKVKSTKGRARKKVEQKDVPKILVEETQKEEMLIQNAGVPSRPGSQVYVAETQPQDEEFDWLSVGKIHEKEDIGNKQSFKENTLRFSDTKPHQKYAKTHNKVVFQEKKIQKDDLQKGLDTDEVPKHVNVIKQSARGRKRKAKREPVVTLVEETQDVEENGPNVSYVKRKRNCFKLESGSEEESIAETQDLDVSSDHKLEVGTDSGRDRDRPHSENGNAGIPSSSTNNAKDFLSPEKNEMTKDSDEEGSQSPIINRKKTFSSASKKVYSKPNIRTDKDYDEVPFKSYKANSTTKKFIDTNTSYLASKSNVQVPLTEFNLQEENEISEGVRRFINRPSSKESTASDTLSTTSSQMSSNILDEKGDLYSTQFCEIKARKGKSFKSKNKSDSQIVNLDEDILMLDASEDDIPVLKEPKKTYAVKSIKKNLPVTKDVWTSGKRDQKVSKHKNIQQYFSKSKQSGNLDVPIELDGASDEDAGEPREYIKAGVSKHFKDTSTLSESKSKYKNVCDKENEQKLTKSSIGCAPTIGQETESEKADVDPLSYEEDTCGQYRNNLGRRMHKGKQTKTKNIHHKNMETDYTQHMLNDLSGASSEKMHNLNENHNTTKLENRNIEMHTNMSDVNSRGKRRNQRVSETVTSEDHDRETKWSCRTRTRDQDFDNLGASGHTVDVERKRAGEYQNSDEDLIVKKKTERVECPLCSRKFPVGVIEEHAATCEGLVDDVDGTVNEEENIDETAEDFNKVLLHHHHQHEQNHHQHHWKLSSQQHLNDQDYHQNYTAASQHHLPQDVLQEQVSGDEAVSHFNQNDVHVKDVAKDFNCSPAGEEGELQLCYICDEYVSKGKPFEAHISRCLAVAAQQQAEVDEKGYNSVYAEPGVEEELQVRTLRGRQVNQDRITPCRSKASRGRLVADRSPGNCMRQKQDICIDVRGSGDGEEENGEISRLEARQTAIDKQGLTKRANRSKITQKDDGSGNSGR